MQKLRPEYGNSVFISCGSQNQFRVGNFVLYGSFMKVTKNIFFFFFTYYSFFSFPASVLANGLWLFIKYRLQIYMNHVSLYTIFTRSAPRAI